MARDTYEVEIDRMGRMPIPSNLRVVASLTREVLIQGAYQTIELWEPAHWRAYDEADEPTMPPTDADGRNG
jgi:MraZ protein